MIALPEIDRAIDTVRERLRQGARRVVVIGPPAAGKTSVLSRLEQQPSGKRLVRVAAPATDADAGAVALVSLAAGLEELSPGLSATVRNPEETPTWTAKLDLLRSAVERRASDLVLLLDEPFAGQDEGPTPLPFGRRVQALAEALLAIPGLQTVVTASEWRPRGDAIELAGRSESSVLADGVWGPLQDAAARLAGLSPALLAGALQRLSPLELRLRVALVFTGTKPESAVRPAPIRKIVSALFDSLGQKGSELRAVVARLSVLRTPFPLAALSRFGADSLDSASRVLLETVLLYPEGPEFRLHEEIAREARSWAFESLVPAHTAAAELHKARWQDAKNAGQVAAALKEEVEVLHHRTESGDASLLLEDSLWFSDQYCGLGRVFGQSRRFPDAVRAYERALEHDQDNAYAHHYLAWNLDMVAEDPIRSENHYRKALELEPAHAWYQSRFVRFLVTRGRAREARLAWDEALAELARTQRRDDHRLYEELHSETARLLLHRGQLELAGEVLDDIPGEFAAQAPWARAERRLLAALEEASEGLLVHPPRVPQERRSSPLLFEPEEIPAGAVWMAGRVDGCVDGVCHLRVARRQGEGWEWGWLHLPEAQLLAAMEAPKLLPPAGVFVEVLERADGSYVLRRHPAEPYFDDALPRLVPPPDRYLSRRVSAQPQE